MSLDGPTGCPFMLDMREEVKFPVGQVHRVSARPQGGEVDETKRNVLKLAAVAGLLGAGGLGVGAGALQFAQPPVVGLSSYPRVLLVDVDGTPLTTAKVEAEYNVTTADMLIFNYPLQNEPNFLFNLAPATTGGTGASNLPYGVGTNKSIVAYSAICQHLGCPAPALSYYPPGTCSKEFNGHDFYVHCTCHGSTYDITNRASNLTGPAVLPLPQVILEVASDGTIYANGMTPGSPPVNGHLDTLQGDYGVAASVPLAKLTPIASLPCTFPP